MLKRALSNERGTSTLGRIIWLLLIGLFIYGCVTIGPMYLAYQMMRHEVVGEAKVAYHYTDAETIKRIMDHAKSWNVPLKEENVVINRGTNTVNVTVRYSVHKSFFGGKYERTFNFSILTTKPLLARH
jgi:hypothetical protein